MSNVDKKLAPHHFVLSSINQWGIWLGDFASSFDYGQKSAFVALGVGSIAMVASPQNAAFVWLTIALTFLLKSTIFYQLVLTNIGTKDARGTMGFISLAKEQGLKNKGLLFSVFVSLLCLGFLGGDAAVTTAVSVSAFVNASRSITGFLPWEFGSDILKGGFLQNALVWIFVGFVYYTNRYGPAFAKKTGTPVIVAFFILALIPAVIQIFNHLDFFKYINIVDYVKWFINNPIQATIAVNAGFLTSTGDEAAASDAAVCGPMKIKVGGAIALSTLLVLYLGQAITISEYAKNLAEGSQYLDEHFSPINEMTKAIAPYFGSFGGIITSVWSIVLVSLYALLCLNACRSMLVAVGHNLSVLIKWGWFLPWHYKHLGGEHDVWVPKLDLVMTIATSLILLLLGTGAGLEGAYGLCVAFAEFGAAVQLALFMYFYFRQGFLKSFLAAIFFLILEGFYIYNLWSKIPHGAWVTFGMSIAFGFALWMGFAMHLEQEKRKHNPTLENKVDFTHATTSSEYF
jgi:K+ transporter